MGETHKWRKFVSRENVDLLTLTEVDQVFCTHFRTFAGTDEELFFTRTTRKNFTHYTSIDPLEVGRMLCKNLQTTEQIERLYEEGRTFLASLEGMSLRIKTSALLTLFNEFLTQFRYVCEKYSITPFLAIEAWQHDTNMILSRLIERNAAPRDAILSAVYAPWKETALVELSRRYRSGEHPERLAQEFDFLRSWAAIWYLPFDTLWVRDIAIEHNTPKLSIEEAMDLLRPTPQERERILLAPHITFFKDWRDDLRRRHVYAWSELFDRIAKHVGITREQLGYLDADEIAAAIEHGRADLALITERSQESIVTMPAGIGSTRILSSQLGRYHTTIEQTEREIFATHGTCASPGRTQGTARIVRTQHDTKHVVEGDVLFAVTTHPNYLPAMRKAVAFVTDEGGVISHAAIVAREMHKPCIVGAKNATTAFKDGDLVEVDANTGIVRKLQP